MTAPAYFQYQVTNAYQLAIDMHKAGFSKEDILWILDLLGWLEPMRDALSKDETEEPTP